MGQVPTNKSDLTCVSILGNGRLGKHLAYYFDLIDQDFNIWTRNSNEALNSTVAESHAVLICFPDDVIDLFIKSNIETLKDKILIHFSGALESKYAIGAHPLMSFPEDVYFDLETYQSIHFITDEDFPGWNRVAPKVTNITHRISTEKKALYHSLCVLSGNFSMMLWNKLFEDLETKLGISRQAAFPYLVQIFESTLMDSKKNMTGPLVRNDRQTIKKNIAALEGDSFQSVYRSFVDAFRESPPSKGVVNHEH